MFAALPEQLRIPIRKGKKEPILGILRNRRKKRDFKL